MINNICVEFDGQKCHQKNCRISINSPTDLLLKVTGSGVCGTDIQILKGIRQEKTQILGHEGIGIVVNDYSNGRYFFQKGQEVLINPTDAINHNFLLGHNLPGLFQKYTIIPEFAIKDNVIIPVQFPLMPRYASLIEPIAVALTAIDAVKQYALEHYIIIGGGNIGNLIAQLLTLRNQSSVTILHHRIQSKKQSKKLLSSVTHLINTEKTLSNLLKKERTAVFIATPKTATNSVLSSVLNSIHSDSVINIIGGVDVLKPISGKNPLPVSNIRAENICPEIFRYIRADNYFVTNKNNIFITGHRGVTNKKIIEALSILTNNSEVFKKYITHVLDFSSLGAFLNNLINSTDRVIDGKYVLKASIEYK